MTTILAIIILSEYFNRKCSHFDLNITISNGTVDNWISAIHVMAYHLFGTKPSPEPMIIQSRSGLKWLNKPEAWSPLTPVVLRPHRNRPWSVWITASLFPVLRRWECRRMWPTWNWTGDSENIGWNGTIACEMLYIWLQYKKNTTHMSTSI